MSKITILGDIICDREMLKKAKYEDTYNFDDMFSPLKGFLSDSDYVIANLETCISNSNYTNSTFSFCTPTTLLDTLKKTGIDCVSLANNHILDRGIDGIEETIAELEKRNINYFGLNDKILKLNLKDINLSIFGYTDSTNYHINRNTFNDSSKYYVNCLKNTFIIKKRNTKSIYKRIINSEIRLRIKNIFHIKIHPVIDNYEIDKKYINKIKSYINEKDRYIIMYSHMGGQYNIDFGTYSTNMINEFKNIGCNSIVITHPHIIQNTYKYKNVFSIGGVIISPTSKYVLWDTYPEFSGVVNYYFKENKLKKITISFLICTKNKNTYLKVYPFYDFYQTLNINEKKEYKKRFDTVFRRIFNYTDDVKKEYMMKV